MIVDKPTYTTIGKDITVYGGLPKPGGMAVEKGSHIVIMFKKKPNPVVLFFYRVILGWHWVNGDY